MTEVIATVQDAARRAGAEHMPDARWNPVYRALVEQSPAVPDPARTPPEEELGAVELDGEDLDLVRRQLCAPALLVVAVTEGELTRRRRIGLDPSEPTIEHSDGEAPSRWSRLDVQDVPRTITALLEEAGIGDSPAQLEVHRSGDALRLSPAQDRLVHEALRSGLSPEQAYARVPDLDESLRDALTATGPRISLSLTLHDANGRVAERPVSWSRLWARGSRGLYRVDQPSGPGLAVHPVGDGDVLGSLLPVLEQGLRFTAACLTAGGSR